MIEQVAPFRNVVGFRPMDAPGSEPAWVEVLVCGHDGQVSARSCDPPERMTRRRCKKCLRAEQQQEKPRVQVIGTDGNVFALMGTCSAALKRAGQHEKATEMQEKVIVIDIDAMLARSPVRQGERARYTRIHLDGHREVQEVEVGYVYWNGYAVAIFENETAMTVPWSTLEPIKEELMADPEAVITSGSIDRMTATGDRVRIIATYAGETYRLTYSLSECISLAELDEIRRQTNEALRGEQ